MADVTAVVANYEGAALLPDCLASLAAQTRPPARVVVVDAGSSDDSVRVARSHGADVAITANRGLGHLYNIGARTSGTELVLLTNNDVAFADDCVELLTRALEDDSTLFAADPRQLDWDGVRRIHGRTLVRRAGVLRADLPGIAIDANADADDVVETAFANAGAMLVRRDVMLRLGGFDETFFLDFEDLDLGWRAWHAGHGSVHVPAAVLRHRVGATTGKTSYRRLRGSHHNLLRFALKCLPAREAAVVVAGELLRLVAHPRPVAAALVQVGRELVEILRLRRGIRPQRRVLDRLLRLA